MNSNFLQPWFFAYPQLKQTTTTGFAASEQWREENGNISQYAKALEVLRKKIISQITLVNKNRSTDEDSIQMLIDTLKDYQDCLSQVIEPDEIKQSGVSIFWTSFIHQTVPTMFEFVFKFKNPYGSVWFGSFDLPFDLYNMSLNSLFLLMKSGVREMMKLSYTPRVQQTNLMMGLANASAPSAQSNQDNERSLKNAKAIFMQCIDLVSYLSALMKNYELCWFEEEVMHKIFADKSNHVKELQRAAKKKEANEGKAKKEADKKNSSKSTKDKGKSGGKKKKKDKDEEEFFDFDWGISDEENENPTNSEATKSKKGTTSKEVKEFNFDDYKSKSKSSKKPAGSFESDMDENFLSFLNSILRAQIQEITFLVIFTRPKSAFSDYMSYKLAGHCSAIYKLAASHAVAAKQDKRSLKLLEYNAEFKGMFYEAVKLHFAAIWHMSKATEISQGSTEQINQAKKHRGYYKTFAKQAKSALEAIYSCDYAKLLSNKIKPCNFFEQMVKIITEEFNKSQNIGLYEGVDQAAGLNPSFPDDDRVDSNAGFVKPLDGLWESKSGESLSEQIAKVNKEELMRTFQANGAVVQF